MIVGREKEITLLNQKLNAPKSEFVMPYGRGRVGKTYLVRNLFKGKFIFQTGLTHATLPDQLLNFYMAMQEQHARLKYDRLEIGWKRSGKSGIPLKNQDGPEYSPAFIKKDGKYQVDD